MAEDQEMRASKAELYNWQLLTRNLVVERALQEAMQRVDGQSRMVPVWVRDIADGEEGLEGFVKLRELVECQAEEIGKLRADLSIQIRQGDALSSSGGSAGAAADEKDRALEKVRSETLKMYYLERDLDDEKKKRKEGQEKHESLIRGLTESIESSARREAQLERASQGSAEAGG